MLYLNCLRLHIKAFHFFETGESSSIAGFVELYSVARGVIENVLNLYGTDNRFGSCSAYFHRSMLLAAFTLLKIVRSPIASYLDVRSGEKCYFSTIVHLRKSTLENDDLHARGAMILTQLWTSDKIFKTATGEANSLSLRIRSRLTMSIVFDCFWWWREEFEGKSSPFQNRETSHEPGKALNHTPQLHECLR